MCLENPTSTTTNNGPNDRNCQQRCEENCASPSGNKFQQFRQSVKGNRIPDQETNVNFKHKYNTMAMEEKRKRLPPGYVNVSTKSLTDVNCDDETKNCHVSYVNTGCFQNTDSLTNESQKFLDLVEIDTKTFKFGLDPMKQEIPLNDSPPPLSSITPPPHKQKLSPQKASVCSQSNSGEFRMNSQCINNEISRTGVVFNNGEIRKENDAPKNCSWYGRSKSRSFSASSVIGDDFSQLVHEVKENISWRDHNVKSRSKTSFIAASAPQMKHEDDRCFSSSIETSDGLFSSPDTRKPLCSTGNLIFGESELSRTAQKGSSNSSRNSCLDHVYQNTGLSAVTKENRSHSITGMTDINNSTSSSAFSSLSTQPSNILKNSVESLPHPRQYIHSAGGGCVSPMSDSVPHVLITSQNHFPYSDTFGLPTQTFSQTNPFLPFLEKEQDDMKNKSKNPFLWIAPDEKDNKCKVEILAVPEIPTFRQLPSQELQSPINVSNNVSVNINNTSPSISPIHVHHHHFHHHYNQSNIESNIVRNQIVPVHSMGNISPEPQSISFTPPPSIDFPVSNQIINEVNAISQNRNASNGSMNENLRLVLKPKKQELSYKDLENILMRNKNLLNTCGWYYGKMKADESTALLNNTAPGTFLVRDSSDPKYWFSLSMQRGNNFGEGANNENSGPTSIRIHFVNGKFQLDAEDRIRNIMPEFDTIIDLVQYYVSTSLHELKKVEEANSTKSQTDQNKSFQNAKSKTLWVDSSGKLYQTIFLAYPLYKKDHVQSLSHMCRLTINSSVVSNITNEFRENIYGQNQYLDSISKLNLPIRIQTFLEEYPNIL